MPVTIGNMTSNVNVVDGNNMLSEAAIEKIIQMTKIQLKQELQNEKQSQQEQEIYGRTSKSELD
jgi:hypothetical protein